LAHTFSGLVEATTYCWRATFGNTSGDGTVSATDEFTTQGSGGGCAVNQHEGADDLAYLYDADAGWTVDALIGDTIENDTDVSSCTITDNDATTITCTLSGGTDNNWDTCDDYTVVSGPASDITVCAAGCDETTIQAAFDNNDFGADSVIEVRAASPGGTATYREMVTWGSNDEGASGQPVVLRGRSGDTINIYGSVDVTDGGTYKWTAGGGGTNEYYVELLGGGDPSLTEPKILWMDGTRLTVGTVDSLADHEWDWGDSDALGYSTIYIRDDTGDPDVSGVVIEAPQRTNGIVATDVSFATIQNFNIKYTNDTLITISESADDCTDWTIDGNTLSGSWRDGVKIGNGADSVGEANNAIVTNNTITDFGGDVGEDQNGVQLFYSDGYTVCDNTITLSTLANNGYGGGVKVSHGAVADNNSSICRNTISGQITAGSSQGGGIFMENSHYVDIYENRINVGTDAGIWFDESSVDVGDGPTYNDVWGNWITSNGGHGQYSMHIERSDNNDFRANIFDLRTATNANKVVWLSRDTENSTLYNNTFIAPSGAQALQLGWTSDPVGDGQSGTKVKNNIFYSVGTAGTLIYVDDANNPMESTGIEIDNNLYNDPDFANIVRWEGSLYASISAFNSAEGQEANRVEGDPLFTDYANGTLTLQSGSPAIDAGENLGSIYDSGLDPNSTWTTGVTFLDQDDQGAWEVGAYIYEAVAGTGVIIVGTTGGTITAGTSGGTITFHP
jgi:hypothetical protein